MTKATTTTKKTSSTTTTKTSSRKKTTKRTTVPRYERIGVSAYLVHSKTPWVAVRRPEGFSGPAYIALPGVTPTSPIWLIEKTAADVLDRLKNPAHDFEYYVGEYIEEKALKPATQATLRQALRGFGLDNDKNKVAIRAMQKNDKFSQGTIRLYMQKINAFYTWLSKKGLIVQNPTDGLKTPKTTPRELNFDAEDVARLLADVDATGTPEDRLYTRLLRWTGARCSTVYALAPSNFERTATGYLVTMQNVKCSRPYRARIPVTDKETVELIAKLASRPSLWGKFSEQALHDRLWRRMKRVIGSDASPHGLRHFVACDLLDKGIDLATISQILDHTSIAITSAIYARHSQAAIDAAMQKLGE